jgi:hypothetical protein
MFQMMNRTFFIIKIALERSLNLWRIVNEICVQSKLSLKKFREFYVGENGIV